MTDPEAARPSRAASGRMVERVPLASDRDVALARRAVGLAMDAMGTRAVRRTRFVTAVSEIARNAVVHGNGGTLAIYVHEGAGRISVECGDGGPGIADLDRALTDGFTTGGGMGRGLGGARRLVERFEVETRPGGGTTVRMTGVA